MNSVPRLIDVDEVQQIFHLKSKSQTYEVMRRLPKGVLVHLGRRVRVNADALSQWLGSGGTQPATCGGYHGR